MVRLRAIRVFSTAINNSNAYNSIHCPVACQWLSLVKQSELGLDRRTAHADAPTGRHALKVRIKYVPSKRSVGVS